MLPPGIQADQRVLSALISTYLPELASLLEQHDIELSLITLNWFLTVFASVVHVRILLRVWDLFFYHGALVVFQVALGMLKMKGGYWGRVGRIVLRCFIGLLNPRRIACIELCGVVVILCLCFVVIITFLSGVGENACYPAYFVLRFTMYAVGLGS